MIVCLTHPLLYYVLLSSSSFIGAGLSVTPEGWTQCLPLTDPTNRHYRTTDNNYYGLWLPQLIMPCPPGNSFWPLLSICWTLPFVSSLFSSDCCASGPLLVLLFYDKAGMFAYLEFRSFADLISLGTILCFTTSSIHHCLSELDSVSPSHRSNQWTDLGPQLQTTAPSTDRALHPSGTPFGYC